jgi:hypothetical protein
MSIEKKAKYIAWIFTPILYYLLPYLSSVDKIYALMAVAPLLILIGLSFSNWNLKARGKEYVILYLYILSNCIHSFLNNSILGIVFMLCLIVWLHVLTGSKHTSLERLNQLGKYFVTGLLILFVCAIFLPLISRYSYTVAAWYWIASYEIPVLRTTLDGPFVLIILIAMVFISMRFDYRNVLKCCLYILFLGFGFYTLLVFNRRVVLLLFFVLIPFIFLRMTGKKRINEMVFALTFLVPLNFLMLLQYAAGISKTSIFKDIFLRSGDLNENNQRLSGWLLALRSFSNISIKDFFAYSHVLVRSDNPRYNHFHNGYIQIYYEQGMFGFITLLILLVYLIRRIRYFKYIKGKNYRYLFIFPVIFLVLMILSITESTYRQIYITNIVFIISSFFIIKITEKEKEEPELVYQNELERQVTSVLE